VNYALSLGVFMAIAVIVAMSLNVSMGYAGLVSIAHGGLMGVGGYTASVLATRYDVPMTVALVAGGVAAAAVGAAFMLAVAWTGAFEFILASFAFQMVLIEGISRWTSVTNGTRGLSAIPRPSLGFGALDSLGAYAAFVGVVTLAAAVAYLAVGRSTFAIRLRALRASVPAVQAAGWNPTALKVAAFAVSAAGAGLAGGLHASMISFAHPADFGLRVSIIAVAYLLVGGVGNMWGAIVGALTLMALPEIVEATNVVPDHLLGPVERIIYGALIMAMVWLRPNGLLPERPIVPRLAAAAGNRRPTVQAVPAG